MVNTTDAEGQTSVDRAPPPKPSSPWARRGPTGNQISYSVGRHAIAEALRAELSQIETVDTDGNPLTRAQVIARMAVNMAMSGDLKTIQFVTERLEGKPRQALQIRRASPSAEELHARLTALVQANPALPDQFGRDGAQAHHSDGPAGGGVREPLRGG